MSDAIKQTVRSVRALIGWMSPEEARLTLAGRRMDAAPNTDAEAKIAAARAAVAARAPGVDQNGVVTPAPGTLDAYFAELRAKPEVAGYFQEGFEVALVDLRRICSFQPTVFSEQADERVANVDPEDLIAIARVSLPIPGEAALPAMFDEVQKSWLIGSPNPNLKIMGRFNGPVAPGVVGFGFIVKLNPSMMSVARLQGRYLLRDGYHRAYGLLRRGIHLVPMFVKEFAPTENPNIPPGMLPMGTWLGERPPFLPDYLDDTVSAPAHAPAIARMVVISGLELTYAV